jgi:hypothetical protein
MDSSEDDFVDWRDEENRKRIKLVSTDGQDCLV